MKVVGVTSYTNFLEASRLRRTGRDYANVFGYNFGTNHSIFILTFALECTGLSPSPVRKALKSDKNCWRDDLYKLALEKTGAQIVMVIAPPWSTV